MRAYQADYPVATMCRLFSWVRPDNLVVDGEFVSTVCDYQVVSDFVFAGGEAQSWQATSRILFAKPGYCPDDESTSNHRPVEAVFELPETTLASEG